MRKSLIAISAVLLFVAVIIFGCDRNKDERASLFNQIGDVEAELTNLTEQRSRVSEDLEALRSEIEQHTDSLQEHTERRTGFQDELGLYILDHKMATLAVIATVGGVASVVEDNIDEDTKEALSVVGFLGALYCIGNSTECADVTARILYFGSQIESEKNIIADVSSKLELKKVSLIEREKEHASLVDMITTKEGERDTLKQKHDSLICRFCF